MFFVEWADCRQRLLKSQPQPDKEKLLCHLLWLRLLKARDAMSG